MREMMRGKWHLEALECGVGVSEGGASTKRRCYVAVEQRAEGGRLPPARTNRNGEIRQKQLENQTRAGGYHRQLEDCDGRGLT